MDFNLPKSYYDMRENNKERFANNLFLLALHQRKSKINSLGH